MIIIGQKTSCMIGQLGLAIQKPELFANVLQVRIELEKSSML